jgi:O-antigen/teichoic acid export membrane protein
VYGAVEPSSPEAEVPAAAPAPPGQTPGLIPLLARNVRALALSETAGKIAGFASMAILARFLGRVDFGRYTVAIALISIVAAIAESGTSSYLVREGAQRPGDLGSIVGDVLLLRTGLAALMLVATVPSAIGLGYGRTTVVAVALFAVAAGARLIGFTFVLALQALERMGEVAEMRAEVSLGQAVAGSVAAVVTHDLIAVSIGVAAASVLFPVWTWYRLRRRWTERLHVRGAGLGATLRTTTSFAVVSTMFVLITYLDSIMVRAFKGDAVTGLYGAAYRVLLSLSLVPTIYNDAITRAMSHLASTDPERMRALYRRAFAHLVMAALPLSVGGAILAHHLLVFVFGAQYGSASTALSILVCSLVMVFPGYVNVTAAYALGLEKRLAVILPFVVAANAGANLWAIPAFGIKGAAATTLGTEVLFIVLLMARLRRSGLIDGLLPRVVKPAIAAAVMAGVVWPLRNVTLAVPLVAGAIVYTGALVALRAFGREDRDLLRALLSRGPVSTGDVMEPSRL